MRVKKLKKIMAIVLAISIIAGVMAVCTGLFAGAASDNLLSNASFEDAGTKGFQDRLIGIGQYNAFVTNWFGYNDRGTRTSLDHTSDSKDGSYAINFKIPSDAMTVTVRPHENALDQSSLTQNGAYYKFSAWVKGTNSTSTIEIETTNGKVYKQSIPAGQTWHKVELDNIFLSKTVKIAGKDYADVNGTRYLYEIRIRVNKDTAEATELTVDNLSLALTDNILADGGFEAAVTVGDGFTDHYVGRGQTNMLTDSFLGYHEYESGKKDVAAISVDHSTNSHSGQYAFYFKMPAYNGTRLTVFPYDEAQDFSEVKAGYYTLSAWVRSTSTASKLQVETDDQAYETAIPVAMDWQKVTLDNIYLTEGATNLKAYKPDTTRKAGYAIKIALATTADYATELYVDDIALTPIEFMSNPDFENGDSGWVGQSTTGATAQSAEIADAKSGSYALKLALPANSGITVNEVALPKADLTQGFYMLAFYAKGSGTLKADTVQGSDSATLNCTLTDDWQLFVQKDIVVDSGELNELKFTAENSGSTAAEIYIDNVQFYRQVGPGGYIDTLSAKIDNKGALVLTVPPEGYEITVLSSSNEEIIALDGTVTLPTEGTTVDLVLKMTNINDETDTAKSETVTVDVPALGGSTVTSNPFIINNGFEGNTIKLNTTSGGVNYTDRIGRGQTNAIVDGWNGFNWWKADNVENAPRFSITEGRSGNDSLKVTSPAGQKDTSVFIYPTSANLDKSGIEGGKYKLSVWVRGTNGHTDNKLRFAALETDGKTVKEYTATITSGEEWHEIVINDIYLTPKGENLQNIKVNGSGVSPFVIQVRGVNDTETYLEFDDITLTRTGDAGALKDDAILQNGSFERNGIGEWGFEGKTFPNEQCNYIIEGWRANQWNGSTVKTAVSHTADAQDGGYALRFDVPVGANQLTMLPDTSAVDTTKVTEGFYNLTFYTKGINTASTISVKTTSSYGSNAEKVYEAKIAPSLDYKQITIENIYLTEGATNLAKASTARENGATATDAKHINFTIKGAAQDTVVYIDNIALTKSDSSDAQLNAIIIDGGIENQTTKQNSIGHGHKAPLTENWAGFNWKATNYVTFGVAAEGVTGNALKFTVPNSGNELKAYIKNEGINLDKITEGYYKLTAYVKTNSTKSYMYVGTTNSATFTADGQWNKVTIENIQLTDNGENLTAVVDDDDNVNGNGYELGFNIVPDTTATGDTYVLIDDISLEKTEAPTPPAPTVENLIINGFDPTNNTGSEVTLTPASRAGQWIDKSAEMTGWIYHSWGPTHSTMGLTNTDTHSAGYALKINVNAGTTDSNYTRYAAKTTNIDTSKITAGKYKLTAWVKGDATNAGLDFLDKTVTVPAEAASGWVKIETEAVTLSGASDLVATNTQTNGVQMYENIRVYVRHQNQGGKYVIFDDITLEKVEEAPAENILKNSSFEEFTCSGTDEHKPGNGQTNVLATGWYNADHWRTTETQAVVTHSTDAKSGSYSLKVDMPVNGAYFRIITPDVDNLTTLSGAYTLSFWIKGDSATVKAQSHNGSAWADVQTVSLTSEWTQVTVAIPEISYYTKNYNNDGGTNNKDTLGVCLYIKGVADKASYVLIDDISLTKVS